jgi:unsaturated chondroitin disaccharide hydrolase
MCRRIDHNLNVLKSEFPHWAGSQTGAWTTTPDGDWTGGAWPGMLWLAARRTGEAKYLDAARLWSGRLKPHARLQTAFKGFGFYYGAALGDLLCEDKNAAALALEAAESLKGQFDSRLGLIPLGGDAEESEDVGNCFSSIDSLQATPLLLWAARKTGDAAYAEVAAKHTSRVLDIHMRNDGSIVQSSELDPKDGNIVRHFTHKGFSDDSVWGRAQAWGLIYTAIALAHQPRENRWMEQLTKGADWWLANVPNSMIAFWDFNDPAIPQYGDRYGRNLDRLLSAAEARSTSAGSEPSRQISKRRRANSGWACRSLPDTSRRKRCSARGHAGRRLL